MKTSDTGSLDTGSSGTGISDTAIGDLCTVGTNDVGQQTEAIEAILQRCCPGEVTQDLSGLGLSELRLVDAKVGRRATYEVTEGNQNRRIFIKCYSEPRPAAFAADAMETLGQFLVPRSAERVVELLGRDEHAVVVAAADGFRLDTLATQTSPQLLGRWAARWLSRLHLAPAQLDRTLDADNERMTMSLWVGSIGEQAGPKAAELMDQFDASRSQVSAPLVPIHKDFHYGHVFVDRDGSLSGGSVTVIDFDEARMGPADFDLAHFVANLEALAAVSRQAWPLMTAREFVAEYSRRTGWQPGLDYDHWRSYCLVKLAWQTTQGFGPPGVAGIQQDDFSDREVDQVQATVATILSLTDLEAAQL